VLVPATCFRSATAGDSNAQAALTSRVVALHCSVLCTHHPGPHTCPTLPLARAVTIALHPPVLWPRLQPPCQRSCAVPKPWHQYAMSNAPACSSAFRLIARNWDDYYQLLRVLVKSPRRLAEIRQRLANSRVAPNSLFDTRAWMLSYETSLKMMVDIAEQTGRWFHYIVA
jgi:hypothetical protein